MKKNGQIASIETLEGNGYKAEVFLDATYESNLMAAAGVQYAVGRESQDKYDEKWAGVHKKARHHRHHFDEKINPCVEPANPDSGLLPHVQGGDPDKEGVGDDRVQAYCFRLCMTKVDENKVPFRKPDDYDPQAYEIMLRAFEKGDYEVFDPKRKQTISEVLLFGKLPNKRPTRTIGDPCPPITSAKITHVPKPHTKSAGRSCRHIKSTTRVMKC